jgi:protein phosphatase 2C family protein 2/3
LASETGLHFSTFCDCIAEAGDYEKALKMLYLKTDEDLRAGDCPTGPSALIPAADATHYRLVPDPNFFNDPSGCTAVSCIITPDGRIIVVSSCFLREVLVLANTALM